MKILNYILSWVLMMALVSLGRSLLFLLGIVNPYILVPLNILLMVFIADPLIAMVWPTFNPWPFGALRENSVSFQSYKRIWDFLKSKFNSQ